MRPVIFSIVLALAGLCVSSAIVSAQETGDGCSRDRYGRLYCAPGARPGVPLYYSDGRARRHRYGETGDGCSSSGWCEPGARPGVPLYGSDGPGRRYYPSEGPYYGRRYYRAW